MKEITMLTSAYKPYEYVDQYCECLSTWFGNEYINKVTVLFGVVDDVYDEETAEKINEAEEKIAKTIDGKGLNLIFVRGDEKESYARTINKLITEHVETEFVGILNLDDWRDIMSIENQVEVLKTGYDLTYGDFVVTNNMDAITKESHSSTVVYEETYNYDNSKNYAETFMRVFKWGPFISWRKSLNDKIKYYDEQLSVASDYDWINRVLYYDFKVTKTPGIMGAFLSIGKGLSTRPDTLGHKENAMVLGRYFSDQYKTIKCLGHEYDWRSL